MEERLIAQMREVEERHWWFAGRREVLLSLVRNELKPGASLLDVGCGTGFFLEGAASHVQAVGLDPSAQAVAFCASRGLAGVQRGGVEDLGRLEARFDAITFFDVLEHLPDDVGALCLARGVLRPGGKVFVSVPAYGWLWSHHDDAHGHHRRYTASLLRARLAEAGFRHVRTGFFNARLFPLALAVRGWQKLTGRAREADLQLPPAQINRWFRGWLAGESRRIGRPGSTGYPFGLSVFGVGTA